jgi:hypothetical protein
MSFDKFFDGSDAHLLDDVFDALAAQNEVRRLERLLDDIAKALHHDGTYNQLAMRAKEVMSEIASHGELICRKCSLRQDAKHGIKAGV